MANRILRVFVLLGALISISGCMPAGKGAAPSTAARSPSGGGAVSIATSGSKALGLYDLSAVDSIEFSVQGGYLPSGASLPRVLIFFPQSPQESYSGILQLVRVESGEVVCQVSLNNLPSAATIVSALTQATLIEVNTAQYVADAGAQLFKIHFRNSTERGYLFEGVSNPLGAIVVRSGAVSLAHLFVQIANSNDCNESLPAAGEDEQGGSIY